MKNLLTFLLFVFVITITSCKSEKNDATSDTSDFSGKLTEEEITRGILSPEILWKFGRLGEFCLSPDATVIAYTVTRYDSKTNKNITDIFTLPVKGGSPVKITASDDSYSNVRWTPDGKRIGFTGLYKESDQIFEMNPDGTGKVRITGIEGGINGFEYSPDGSKILFIKKVKMEPALSDLYPDLPLANVRMAEDLMYRHWNRWSDGTYSHIYFTAYSDEKISTGKDIMEGEPWDAPMSPYFDQAEIRWSPDGRYIAYTCKKMKGKDYALSTNSDIYIYDTESGTTDNITKGMKGYDRYPVFSPDGSKIAWQSMKTPGFEADKDRLIVMDLQTGEVDYITQNIDQDATHIAWAKDGNSIYFISGVKATYQLYIAGLQTKNIRPVTSGRQDYISFETGNNLLIGNKMSMSMAPELFSIDPASGEETQLSFINKNIYDNINFGDVEERWITTTDNKQMLVWIIYPPGFDPQKKYPALLYCQGGPQSAVSQFFSYRWNFQIMAANGYIIVAPNRRGLPTFGSEWNNQISGDYGGQNIKDYLSAIDALSNEPFIDKEHLGAIGASYGGFSVFYLAGHHEGRFKAFISHCGIYNFESMYASTEEMFFVNHDYEGAYWEKPRPGSFDFSPHRFVDKWDTPILIITGEKDFRIPYTESIQAFNAAQLRGIPSKLLVFPDETHFVTKPQNSILWQREFFKWLDTWLKY